MLKFTLTICVCLAPAPLSNRVARRVPVVMLLDPAASAPAFLEEAGFCIKILIKDSPLKQPRISPSYSECLERLIACVANRLVQAVGILNALSLAQDPLRLPKTEVAKEVDY